MSGEQGFIIMDFRRHAGLDHLSYDLTSGITGNIFPAPRGKRSKDVRGKNECSELPDQHLLLVKNLSGYVLWSYRQ